MHKKAQAKQKISAVVMLTPQLSQQLSLKHETILKTTIFSTSPYDHVDFG